jgi:hypothetical protein
LPAVAEVVVVTTSIVAVATTVSFPIASLRRPGTTSRVARDRILAPIVGADARYVRSPAVVGRVTAAATVGDHHLGLLLLLGGGVDFRHLDAGAGIGKGGEGTVLQDLGLQLELPT